MHWCATESQVIQSVKRARLTPCKFKLNQANPTYDVDSNTETDKKLLRKLRHTGEQYTFKTEYT